MENLEGTLGKLISQKYKLEKDIDLLQSDLRVIESNIQQARFNIIRPLFEAFTNNSQDIFKELFEKFPSVTLYELKIEYNIYMKFNVGMMRGFTIDLNYRACASKQEFSLGIPSHYPYISKEIDTILSFVKKLNLITNSYIKEEQK